MKPFLWVSANGHVSVFGGVLLGNERYYGIAIGSWFLGVMVVA